MGNENLRFQDLTQRINKVIKSQKQTMLEYYDKNEIDIIYGHGSFVDPHTIKVEKDDGKVIKIDSKYFLIACGTRPARKGIFFQIYFYVLINIYLIFILIFIFIHFILFQFYFFSNREYTL
jgi:hypothetical protein